LIYFVLNFKNPCPLANNKKRGIKMNLFDYALVIQLFILINPLSSFPVLLAAYKNRLNVKKIAVSAVVVAFVVAIIIAIVGPYLFQLFKISIDSFRVAGGVVLLLLGLDKISGKQNNRKDVKETDALVSIIATPLLTGPSTIAFITLKAFDIGRISMITNIFFAFIAVAVIFIIFAFTIAKINVKVIDIVSRILGLFLTAVAIEMIAKGIHGLFALG